MEEKKQQCLFNWNHLDEDFEDELIPDIRADETATSAVPLVENHPDWTYLTNDCCEAPEKNLYGSFTFFQKKSYEAQQEQLHLLKEIIQLLKSYRIED